MASVPLPHQFAVGEAVTSTNINTYYTSISYLENPPIANLYQNTPQSIPNVTDTAIHFDGTIVDTYNGHSNSTNNTRYTAQVPGYYQVIGSVSFQQNSAGGRYIRLLKNGSVEVLSSATEQPPSSDFNCIMSTGLVQLFLNINDYMEVIAFQDSGGSLNTLGTFQFVCGFQIRWVHA